MLTGAIQFSSTPAQHRAHGLLSKNRASLPGTSYTALRFSQTNTLIRNAASIRFASTTPLPASTVASNASTSEAASSAAASTPPQFASEIPSNFSSSLDSATEFSSESLYNIPEHIGYLHELGLDYGWGPTSVMQWIIEHIHVYAGTPWWVSISLAAIAMRAVLFKPYVDAAENAARMQTIMPITKPLSNKMQEAAKAGDNALVMQIRGEIQMITRRAGVKLWKGAVPMVQVFAGYGTFVLLRAMSNIPVPGLETGGFLWIYNLTVPDPFFILPLATSAVLHWVLRVSLLLRPSSHSPPSFPTLHTCLSYKSNIHVERRRDRRNEPLPRNDQSHDLGFPRPLPPLHLVAPSRRPNILLRLRRPLLHPILSLPPTLVPILLQDDASPRPQRSQRASSIALPRRYEDRQSGSVTE